MKEYFAHSAGRPTDPPREYWQQEDETLFLRRVGHADVVAVGSLHLVRLHDRRTKPLPQMMRTGFALNVTCALPIFVLLRLICPLYGWA